MAVESLSKAAELRILQATGNAVDLVLAGHHPTEAVVKAASALNLPRGHSRLVARAYNVAKTNEQREHGNTVLEKSADFPLADGDAAEEQRFPATAGKKSAGVTEVSIEYQLQPALMLAAQAATDLAERSKVAAEMLASEEKLVPLESYFNSKTAYARAQQARSQCDQLRAEAAWSFDKLAASFSELGTYFQSAKQAAYADTVEHAAIMGNREALLALALIRPCLSTDVKSANASAALHSRQQAQYILLDTIKTASRDYAERLSKLQERRQDFKELLPKVERKRLGSESVLTEKIAAGFMSGILGSATGTSLGNAVHDAAGSPFDQEKAYAGAVDAIQDPNHEAQLKNIRTQAMLHSLMMHDPVIRGYDPNEVLTAFNELSETAPRISDQTLAMQPLLRKRLTQGVLDPFEVSQVMSMDNAQKTPAAGGVKSVLG